MQETQQSNIPVLPRYRQHETEEFEFAISRIITDLVRDNQQRYPDWWFSKEDDPVVKSSKVMLRRVGMPPSMLEPQAGYILKFHSEVTKFEELGVFFDLSNRKYRFWINPHTIVIPHIETVQIGNEVIVTDEVEDLATYNRILPLSTYSVCLHHLDVGLKSALRKYLVSNYEINGSEEQVQWAKEVFPRIVDRFVDDVMEDLRLDTTTSAFFRTN